MSRREFGILPSDPLHNRFHRWFGAQFGERVVKMRQVGFAKQ